MAVLRVLPILIVAVSLVSAEHQADDTDEDILPFDYIYEPENHASTDDSYDYAETPNHSDVQDYSPFKDSPFEPSEISPTRRKISKIADDNTRHSEKQALRDRIYSGSKNAAYWLADQQSETEIQDRQSRNDRFRNLIPIHKPAINEDNNFEWHIRPIRPSTKYEDNINHGKYEKNDIHVNLSPFYRPSQHGGLYGTRGPAAVYIESAEKGSHPTKAKYKLKIKQTEKVEGPSSETEKNHRPIKKPKRVVHKKLKVKRREKIGDEERSSKKSMTVDHPRGLSRRFLTEEKSHNAPRGRITVKFDGGSQQTVLRQLKNQFLVLLESIRQAIVNIEPMVRGVGNFNNGTEETPNKITIFNVVIEKPKNKETKKNDRKPLRPVMSNGPRSSFGHYVTSTRHVHKRIHQENPAKQDLHKPVDDLSSESEENETSKEDTNTSQEKKRDSSDTAEQVLEEAQGNLQEIVKGVDRRGKMREKLLEQIHRSNEEANKSPKDRKIGTKAQKVRTQKTKKVVKEEARVQENVAGQKSMVDQHLKHPKTGTKHLTVIDDLISAFNDLLPDNNNPSALVGSESSNPEQQRSDQHHRRYYSEELAGETKGKAI